MRISKLEVILESVKFGKKSIEKAMEEIDELFGIPKQLSNIVEKQFLPNMEKPNEKQT